MEEEGHHLVGPAAAQAQVLVHATTNLHVLVIGMEVLEEVFPVFKYQRLLLRNT